MLERLKKDPKIEFFTNADTLLEVVPIVPDGKLMPTWWKQMKLGLMINFRRGYTRYSGS